MVRYRTDLLKKTPPPNWYTNHQNEFLPLLKNAAIYHAPTPDFEPPLLTPLPIQQRPENACPASIVAFSHSRAASSCWP